MLKNQLFKVSLILFLFLSKSAISQNSEYLTLSAVTDRLSYSSNDTITAALKIVIKDKFHINSYETDDPTLIKTTVSTESDKFSLINSYFPSDKKLKFEFSETEIRVYEKDIVIGLKFKINSNLNDGKYDLPVQLNFQACDDKVCYPPKSIKANVPIEIKNESPSKALQNANVFALIDFSKPTLISEKVETQKTKLTENQRTESPDTNEDQVSNWIEEKGIAFALLLIFLGGLALNLTPCVYPLIPITVSFFGAQSSGSKLHSVMMGVFYALGMAVTYSALGVFAALTGSLLGTALQNPIVIIAIALILLALGTSMFGLFEIRVPQKLALIGNENRSGYFGSLLMGLTVGFIAAPCIGPFVLSLLVYVGKIGNPLTGFLLFFILAMGLGLPYIFLAASSSSISKLPRSGEWMEGVKVIFGLILFGMALNTLSPLIPGNIYKIIFPLYIVLAGLYLILFDKKGKTSGFYTKLKYIIAVAGIVFGVWNLIPREHSDAVKWKNLTSASEIEKQIKAENKPVMIDFYADWCAQCKELDEYTYTDPGVIELSESTNNIKIDLTKENEEITNKYNIKGLPVVIFMNSKGEEVKELRVTGFLKPEEFKKKIESLKN